MFKISKASWNQLSCRGSDKDIKNCYNINGFTTWAIIIAASSPHLSNVLHWNIISSKTNYKKWMCALSQTLPQRWSDEIDWIVVAESVLRLLMNWVPERLPQVLLFARRANGTSALYVKNGIFVCSVCSGTLVGNHDTTKETWCTKIELVLVF